MSINKRNHSLNQSINHKNWKCQRLFETKRSKCVLFNWIVWFTKYSLIIHFTDWSNAIFIVLIFFTFERFVFTLPRFFMCIEQKSLQCLLKWEINVNQVWMLWLYWNWISKLSRIKLKRRWLLLVITNTLTILYVNRCTWVWNKNMKKGVAFVLEYVLKLEWIW